jgi:hypothetical protein
MAGSNNSGVVVQADGDIYYTPSAGSNLSDFRGNEAQPAGFSIMTVVPLPGGLPQYHLPTQYYVPGTNDQVQANYDYNRIAAIYLDEPFGLLNWPPFVPPNQSKWTNPCLDDPNSPTDRYPLVTKILGQIQGLAQTIRQQAPKTRLWVNYSEPEMEWMMDPTCPNGRPMTILNGPFIDVVSMDKYLVPFAGTNDCLVAQQSANCVQPYYDFLVNNRAYPGQQIALLPGIFANSTGSNAQAQASLLQGFFDYATSQNQVCNNPLGNTGATGHADGCLVWMVLGFAANDGACSGCLGEDNPAAAPIQQLWRAEVSLPLTVPLTRPSSIATVLTSNGTPFTYFLTSGGQVYDIWCTTSGCAWDDPSGDAARGPDGAPPPAGPTSPLNAVATASGLVAYYLADNGADSGVHQGHLISLNTSQGFSDTWQDITAAGGNFTPAVGSPLVTILNGQTPWTFFLTGGGTIIDNWCPNSTCGWDDPSGDAARGPDGAPPAAFGAGPVNVLSTANGLMAYYLTNAGHVISLNTSLGFSDTWQDVTASGGNFSAALGSPLATVLNGQTPWNFFLVGGGTIIDNWCPNSACAWDDPSGDAGRGPDGTPPAVAIGSPVNVVSTSKGLIAYYLASSGHVISLNTSLGFSDTWQDITAASASPAAASESPLTTVVTANGTSITHFVVPGGHLYSISCTSLAVCTAMDETQSANAAPVSFF